MFREKWGRKTFSCKSQSVDPGFFVGSGRVVFGSICLVSLLLGFEADHASAYRPYLTEDATVSGAGVPEVELAWDHFKLPDAGRQDVLLLVPVYGVSSKLEASAEIPFVFDRPGTGEKESGFGDIALSAKYLLRNGQHASPAFALAATWKLDTASPDQLGSGNMDLSVLVAATHEWEPLQLELHSMLGYTFLGGKRDDNIHDIYFYGVVLEHELTETIDVGAELIGNRNPDRRVNEHLFGVLFGILYEATERFAWDASIRFGIRGDAPDWVASTGVTLAFSTPKEH